MHKLYTGFMRLCLALLLLASATAYAQDKITVKGRVTEQGSGTGIPSVSILDAASKKGLAMTDPNGNFTITIEAGKTLLFRFIGYQDKTVKADRATINITMGQAETGLKEQVVVGYQKRSRETMTGASSSISHKDLQNAPVPNLEQLLQGKVAGMNIQVNTGAPGFGGTISIRGISQLNISGSGDQAFLASSNPLLVIDNVPVEYDGGIDQSMLQPGSATGPLALIPPEDVESIEIYKDAQAASLYGSRGANGVIVITTKRGNSPVPIISTNNSLFVNVPPPLRPVWGGSKERDYRLDAILNYSKSERAAREWLDNAQFLSDSLNGFFNNSTDWQGLFYQTTLNTNNNLQITGGNAKMNYKANLAYQMNQGVIKNTGFNKYSLNMQLNMQPNDRLRVGGQLFAAYGQKKRGNGGGLTGNGAGNAFSSSLLPGPSHFLEFPELRAYLENVDDNNTLNLRGFLNVEYELIKGLRLQSTTSYDYYTDTRDRFNRGFSNNGQTLIYGYVGRRGELNTRNGLAYTFSTRPDDSEAGHNILVSAFTEANINENEQHIREMRNGPSDFYWGPRGYSPRFFPGNPWNDANGVNSNGTPVSRIYHALSYAGFISYNYLTRYVLDLSYRADGNSSSGLSSRYSVNPALGLRWNFNKEAFFKNMRFLDYGSARASYGINSRPVANQVNSLGIYQVYADYNNQRAIGPEFGLMPNPFLTSEKSRQFNIGMDASLFKGRFSFTYDTYYKRSYNLVMEVPLTDVTGYNRIQMNGGAIVNYGHELSVTVRPVEAKTQNGFQWTFTANGAINRSVLTELPGGLKSMRYNDGAPYYQDIARKVGRNPLSNYLYKTEGIYMSDGDVPVDPIRGVRYKTGKGNNPSYFMAGDPIWRDVNGDYMLDDDEDNVIAGNPEPRATGGLSNTVSYKNFSLNVYCSFTWRRDLLNNAIAARLMRLTQPNNINYTGGIGGTVNIYDIDQLNYWRGPGDASAKYPNVYYFYRNGQIQPFRLDQTMFMEDGSYFKINQVTLNYNFRGHDFMRRLKVRTLRLYTTLYNLAVLSKYSGPNPEMVSQLGRDDINGYPAARSFTIGFNAEF